LVDLASTIGYVHLLVHCFRGDVDREGVIVRSETTVIAEELPHAGAVDTVK
jgi:hypothetical protein